MDDLNKIQFLALIWIFFNELIFIIVVFYCSQPFHRYSFFIQHQETNGGLRIYCAPWDIFHIRKM